MEYDDEELNNLVIATDSPTTTQPLAMDVTSGPVLINATNMASTTIAPGVLPTLTSIKFWSENRKICEMFTQAIHDLTRDLDPFAVLLILVALIIAIVGAIAIVCQCQMWRKSKRQRHHDTSSWLEYSLDREKLTHSNNNQHNAKLQRQMENKKFISKLFQSSLLPPVPLPALGSHQVHKVPLGAKPFTLNDSQLYLNSPNKHFTVDIDQCQLVQSFMKHSETGKQYMEGKKKLKNSKEKENAKGKQGLKKPGKGARKGEAKGRSNRAKHAKKADTADTLPFFANASLSSSSKMSDHENRSSTVPAAALQKEYETQTLELNLTGSDDGESQINVDIDEKIYERILTYPRAGMAVANSKGGGAVKAVTAASKASTEAGKPQSSGVLSHCAPKAAPAPLAQPSSGRLRQLVPPSNISEAVARANHSRNIASKLAASKSGYYPPSSASTLAKNPLYSEIGDHEESIIFSDESHPATRTTPATNKATIGGFALENESRLYAPMQPPMNRQLTYSTFIKPPSPPFR